MGLDHTGCTNYAIMEYLVMSPATLQRAIGQFDEFQGLNSGKPYEFLRPSLPGVEKLKLELYLTL